MIAGTLALAGCGGSSGEPETPPATEEPTVPKSEADDAKQEAADEKARADAAEAALMQATARAMFEAIKGGPKRLHMKDGVPSGAEEYMAGMTAAVMKPFAEVYNTLAGGAYTIPTNNPVKVASSKDLPSGAGTITYATPGAKVFAGTFGGAPGTFTCPTEGQACTVAADGDNLTFVGGWTFKPNPGAMATVSDTDYITYGWWTEVEDPRLQRVGDSDTIGVYSYAKSDAWVNSGARQLPTGNATYVGKSSGLYALNDPLDATRAEAGSFTADAEIKASFGANNSAHPTANISGTIDNFMANGEAKKWAVMLSAHTDGNVGDGTVGSGTGTTAWKINGISSEATPGEFAAKLYAPGTADGVPTLVGGTYGATFDSLGQMIGSFGAERK